MDQNIRKPSLSIQHLNCKAKIRMNNESVYGRRLLKFQNHKKLNGYRNSIFYLCSILTIRVSSLLKKLSLMIAVYVCQCTCLLPHFQIYD